MRRFFPLLDPAEVALYDSQALGKFLLCQSVPFAYFFNAAPNMNFLEIFLAGHKHLGRKEIAYLYYLLGLICCGVCRADELLRVVIVHGLIKISQKIAKLKLLITE